MQLIWGKKSRLVFPKKYNYYHDNVLHFDCPLLLVCAKFFEKINTLCTLLRSDFYVNACFYDMCMQSHVLKVCMLLFYQNHSLFVECRFCIAVERVMLFVAGCCYLCLSAFPSRLLIPYFQLTYDTWPPVNYATVSRSCGV